ncbi:hypothetical protein O9929_17890 [Vibrio lentus]|nr:hypothetical protein [Vibrio lentus]
MDLLEFEQNIKENIETLFKESQKTLLHGGRKKLHWRLLLRPKNLDDSGMDNEQQVHYRLLDPSVDWKEIQ